MAESIFKHIVNQKGYGPFFNVDSAGTAGYHIGKQPDHRTLEVLVKHGLSSDHLGQKLGVEDFEKYDHIVVMDEENFEFVHQLYHKTLHKPPATEKLFLIRDFDPNVRGVQEVPDPYYGGQKEFEEVFNILNRSCEVLVDHLAEMHGLTPTDEEE